MKIGHKMRVVLAKQIKSSSGRQSYAAGMEVTLMFPATTSVWVKDGNGDSGVLANLSELSGSEVVEDA